MATCVRASDLSSADVPRSNIGFPELDWLYGHSVIGGRVIWGWAKGGITLLAGEKGVGKSRLSIELAKKQIEAGLKVLYFQTEIDLQSFGRWLKGVTNKHLLFCSDASTLADQLDTIRKIQPHLVLIDSVNQIEEYNTGSTRDVKKVVSSFREITNSMSLHIIFIVQLNKDGSVKGSSTLPHLVDTELFAKHLDGSCIGITTPMFVVELGKHRFGPNTKEYWTEWHHTETGVECRSTHRMENSKWCSTHGLQERLRRRPTPVEKRRKIFGIF